MIALVDTSVWSLALRRSNEPAPEAIELASLIRAGHAQMIGPIRQELLSGVKSTAQFENLRQHLRGFADVELNAGDFELAAEFSNACRRKGVQGSHTDFLICAVAARRQFAVFTTDLDFAVFAKVISIRLHRPRT